MVYDDLFHGVSINRIFLYVKFTLYIECINTVTCDDRGSLSMFLSFPSMRARKGGES